MKGAPHTLAKMAPASGDTQGPVRQFEFQGPFVGADLAALKVELDAFVAKLDAAGLMAPEA